MTYAFFDLDGTIIREKSMFAFQEFFYRSTKPKFIAGFMSRSWKSYFDLLEVSGVERITINRLYYTQFSGQSVSLMKETSQLWYRYAKEQGSISFVPSIVDRLKWHKARGHILVLVSGSFKPLVESIAEDLGVHKVIATDLVVDGGIYTGKIVPPQVIGSGKADAIERLCSANNVDLNECFAYGDHISDAEMLEVVGNPCAVIGDENLKRKAAELGWDWVNAN